MSEIKPGDRVWMPKEGDTIWATTTVESLHDAPDGPVIYGDWSMHDARLVLPHSPALPRVARLLASDGGTLAAAVRQSADLLAHYGCGYTDVLQRQIALMHQLAAALEGTDGN